MAKKMRAFDPGMPDFWLRRLLLGRRVTAGADGLLAPRDAAEDLVHVGAVDGFAFEEEFGEAVQGVAVFAEDVQGVLFGLAEEGGDFLVDDALGGFGVGAAADFFAAQVHGAAAWKADGAEFFAHPEFADHAGGQVGGAG